MELVRKIVKARHSDRLIDADIYDYMKMEPKRPHHWRIHADLPAFTYNVDDAMRLIPDNWRVRSLSECEGEKHFYAWACTLIDCNKYEMPNVPEQIQTHQLAWGAALAVCAAALEAQELIRGRADGKIT